MSDFHWLPNGGKPSFGRSGTSKPSHLSLLNQDLTDAEMHAIIARKTEADNYVRDKFLEQQGHFELSHHDIDQLQDEFLSYFQDAF